MRVPLEQEYKFLLPSSERKNLKNFELLLPHFYHSVDSDKRIIKNLSLGSRSYKENYIDALINLNSQRRAWFDVTDLTNNSQHDKAFLKYRKCVERRLNNVNGNLYNTIISYHTFKSNRIIVGNQEQKLTKYLLKNKYISQAEVNEINTIKVGGDRLYFCISRNPIDYLFCSTDQSFGSCENLFSEGEGCFYMGLGGLVLDTNRAMMFLSKGKIKKFTVKGLEFKHFKYTSRSFALLNEHDELIYLYYYPNEHVNFSRILEKENIKGGDGLNIRSFESKFDFKPAKFEDGSHSGIYLDVIGRRTDRHNNVTYSLSNGSTGSCFGYDSNCTFEELSCFDDLNDNCYHYCENCGDRWHRDEIIYNEGGYPYCVSCHEDIFTVCYSCDYEVTHDDCHTVDSENICSNCLREYTVTCVYCEERVFTNNTEEMSNGDKICKYCYSNEAAKCEECGDIVLHEDVNDDEICLSCQDYI